MARKTAARPAATDAAESRPPLDAEWPEQLYRVLKAAQVRQVSYVPDAGHSALIRLFAADGEVKSNVLTTEEEGIAIATGAWLGGTLDTSASVVAAGALISDAAMKTGVIVKFSQNALIGVAAFWLAIWWALKLQASGQRASAAVIWSGSPNSSSAS